MSRTIAAVSTGSAPGGIGIVRISGPEARAVADRVFRSKSGRTVAQMKGYTAALGGAFAVDGQRLDDVVALVFAAPKSYTGEDVVELSCHGGLYITRRILQEVLRAGAVPAQPGEFTRRAFLNGKMDLAQAEAVMQLISAGGEQAARAAEAGSSGRLSQAVGALREELSDLAAHLAAWADFPEEDVPAITAEGALERLQHLEKELTDLLATFDRGKLYREGVETVIAGRPNVGKSTLMNLLAGHQRSIVTAIPGTTRDVVEETVSVGGVPLRLSDTAGLRETSDPVESMGVLAARQRLETAQLVLAVFDGSQPLTKDEASWLCDLDPRRTVAVLNKCDLPAGPARQAVQQKFPQAVEISASTGAGLAQLEQAVSALLGARAFEAGEAVLFTDRQRDDVRRARDALGEAASALRSGLTLDAATVCVEEALAELYALTGQRVSEAIIDRVFDQFCVGK